MSEPSMMLVTPDFPPAVGGIQRLLGAVTDHLCDDWNITVVAPADRTRDTAAAGGRARVLRTHASWGGRGSALVLAEMAAIVALSRADLYVAGHVMCLPPIVATRPRARLAVWVYGSELWAPAGRLLLKHCAAKVRRTLAISAFTAEQAVLDGVHPERIRICPPGVDPLPKSIECDENEILQRFNLLDEHGHTRPYIVTVARLAEPHKGHELLLRTWPAISARYPEARCVIVGDGPLAGRFRRVSQVSGASESVLWLGRLDEATKFTVLSRARAFVMASTIEPAAAQFEGSGLTYLEAAQLARPSIAADAAGPADVVEDGLTGLKVEPGDQIALLEAIDRLMGDPWLAMRLGQTARDRVQEGGTWRARMPAIRSALAEAAR